MVQELHKGNIIIPTSDQCSETKHFTDILYNEMTHIKKDRTPKGLSTYVSGTKNDDVCMAFLMLIKSMVEEEPFLSYVRVGRYDDKKVQGRVHFDKVDNSVVRFNIETH